MHAASVAPLCAPVWRTHPLAQPRASTRPLASPRPPEHTLLRMPISLGVACSRRVGRVESVESVRDYFFRTLCGAPRFSLQSPLPRRHRSSTPSRPKNANLDMGTQNQKEDGQRQREAHTGGARKKRVRVIASHGALGSCLTRKGCSPGGSGRHALLLPPARLCAVRARPLRRPRGPGPGHQPRRHRWHPGHRHPGRAAAGAAPPDTL